MAYNNNSDSVKEVRVLVKNRKSGEKIYRDKVGKVLIYSSGKIVVNIPYPPLWAEVVTDADWKAQFTGGTQAPAPAGNPYQAPAGPATPF